MYIDHQEESAKRLPQDWKHIYIYILRLEKIQERERKGGSSYVKYEITKRRMKKGREENKERMGSKTVNLIFYR